MLNVLCYIQFAVPLSIFLLMSCHPFENSQAKALYMALVPKPKCKTLIKDTYQTYSKLNYAKLYLTSMLKTIKYLGKIIQNI